MYPYQNVYTSYFCLVIKLMKERDMNTEKKADIPRMDENFGGGGGRGLERPNFTPQCIFSSWATSTNRVAYVEVGIQFERPNRK